MLLQRSHLLFYGVGSPHGFGNHFEFHCFWCAMMDTFICTTLCRHFQHQVTRERSHDDVLYFNPGDFPGLFFKLFYFRRTVLWPRNLSAAEERLFKLSSNTGASDQSWLWRHGQSHESWRSAVRSRNTMSCVWWTECHPHHEESAQDHRRLTRLNPQKNCRHL